VSGYNELAELSAEILRNNDLLFHAQCSALGMKNKEVITQKVKLKLSINYILILLFGFQYRNTNITILYE
jgi:hypothetical protein